MGRPKGSWTGSNNCRWKGGRYTTAGGKVYVKRPGHPMANKCGYVIESRLIMSEHLGRILKPTELVHHINGDSTDNRIANLVIINRSDHASLHHRGLIKPASIANLTYVPPKVPIPEYQCEHCGRRFIPKRKRRNSHVFCSKSCSTKHWRSRLR